MNYKILALLLLFPLNVYASSLAFSLQGGYSPSAGGAMHTGWQAENLGVSDGINDVNRTSSAFDVSTVESPVGITTGLDARYITGMVYFGIGADVVYTMWGGSGKTVNAADTELVKVSYNQWACYVPVYAGVTILFWGETRISTGAGAAFAYGTLSTSFKSASLDHEGNFTAYSFPLFWEMRGERMVSESVSFQCRLAYYTGSSRSVSDGDDYARVDFSGYQISAGIVKYFIF